MPDASAKATAELDTTSLAQEAEKLGIAVRSLEVTLAKNRAAGREVNLAVEYAKAAAPSSSSEPANEAASLSEPQAAASPQ